MVSAGADGYIRWWPFEQIDLAEADYDSGTLNYSIPMKSEVMVPHSPYPGAIETINVSKDGSKWVIQDSRNGIVWIFNSFTKEFKKMIRAHR